MVEAVKPEEVVPDQDLIGQRVEQRGKRGSIRYVGKLQNNPKAGGAIWLGIEWDEEGAGKHDGTVDGIKYFESEFHVKSEKHALGETKSCSFIRFGKIKIGGLSLSDAIMEKYKPDSMKTEEELAEERKREEAELYVNTGGSRGFRKIEIVGLE